MEPTPVCRSQTFHVQMKARLSTDIGVTPSTDPAFNMALFCRVTLPWLLQRELQSLKYHLMVARCHCLKTFSATGLFIALRPSSDQQSHNPLSECLCLQWHSSSTFGVKNWQCLQFCLNCYRHGHSL